jgi:hypothetical protein
MFDNARTRAQAKIRKPKTAATKKPIPHWDRVGRKLWLGACLVKEFPRLSKCQELILEAFEEQGWPEAIDDPLPMEHNIDPKRRLHDAIKRLNRSRSCPALSFHGNGNGQGITCKLRRLEVLNAPIRR